MLISKLPFFGTFLRTSNERSLLFSFTGLKFQLDDLNKTRQSSHLASCFTIRAFSFCQFSNTQGSKRYAKNLPPIALEILYVFLTKELWQILENGFAVKGDKLLPANLKKWDVLRFHSKAFGIYMPVMILTLFIVSTVHGCVQKQSCTDINVIPACSEYKLVNIMWLESNEWTKFGAKAFFCLIVSSFLMLICIT